MKNHLFHSWGLGPALLVLLSFPAVSLAEVEIDLDSLGQPTPQASQHPKDKAQAAPSPAPSSPKEVQSWHPEPTATDTPEAKVETISGRLRMKDIYEAGIKSYKEKDYDQAIRYLKRAVLKKDDDTPRYYFAEAYATLGVIYQFRIIDHKKAAAYYRQALKYEAGNRTAKKHLKELSRKTR